MTREDKELLYKDLCSRIPYGVMVFVPNHEGDYDTKFNSDLLYLVGARDIKPYLRPMKSITREEYDSINKEFLFYGDSILHTSELFTCGEATDWMNAHHFDYRGLIEKGLAIEAPEDMYSSSNLNR